MTDGREDDVGVPGSFPITTGLKPVDSEMRKRVEFSREQRERISARLRELDEARARAEVASRSYVIFGANADSHGHE